jgi:hypothetical protein
MPLTSMATRIVLNLPEHGSRELSSWCGSELHSTPEELLEALAEELCSNGDLRAGAAGLMGD